MNKYFDAFILRFSLDTVIPLKNGTYTVSRSGVTNLSITVNNTFYERQNLGSNNIAGNVQVHHNLGNGISKVELEYSLESPMTVEEFSKAISISPIWHLSCTGWDFALEDLNRIIDLYRYLTNAYWWPHVSMWNVDELSIYGKQPLNQELIFISQSSSPKSISLGGERFDGAAYDQNSVYLMSVKNGKQLPFYFLMYMNGRRSLAEHNYREALINWANCVEAYGIYLLLGVCVLTGKSPEGKKDILDRANEYRKRYSKAYELLAKSNIFPSVSKRRAMQQIDAVMEYRNDVMHGLDPALDWRTVGEKQDAVQELLGIAIELSI